MQILKLPRFITWQGNDAILLKSEYLNRPNQLTGIKHRRDSFLSIHTFID